MLRKRDELQFPLLFANIRMRPEQGILIFLSCRTPEVEALLVDKLKAEFSRQFPIKEVSFSAGYFAPLQFIVHSDDFSSRTLYIVNRFPFEDYYKNPGSMERQMERLTAALNINRQYFTSNDLKCVFICPPEVEDRIALKAADFYLFTHYTASFTDDLSFRREIESLGSGGNDRRERIVFLSEVLERTSGEEDRAYLYAELGKTYYDLSEIDKALTYLQDAQTIYKKSKNKRKLADVLGSIGLVYYDLGQPEEALKYLKDAKRIFLKLNIPVPGDFTETISRLTAQTAPGL